VPFVVISVLFELSPIRITLSQPNNQRIGGLRTFARGNICRVLIHRAESAIPLLNDNAA
jgi:hypothetical protein